jgi:hypothetical protein
LLRVLSLSAAGAAKEPMPRVRAPRIMDTVFIVRMVVDFDSSNIIYGMLRTEVDISLF